MKITSPKNIKEEEKDWYTTTFNIPKWMARLLKNEAEEAGYRGMNMVVVIACTNHLLSQQVREDHNKKIDELHKRGSITSQEKEELWM
jgi:hypothetical protein